MRVLVTGAGGFIGRAVIGRLEADGFETIAFIGPEDLEPPSSKGFVRGEIRDRALVEIVIRDASAVVHIAGPASVANSYDNPAHYASVHSVGAAVVFDAARRAGLARSVLISSAEVYGEPDVQPVCETTVCAPRSPYGAAKLAAEWIARTVHPDGLVIIRPFSVYGGGMRRDSVLGRIVHQLLTGGPIVLKTLEPVRDYLHVDDLAALISLALSKQESAPRVLNACSGMGISVGDLALLAMKVAGGSGAVLEESARQARPNDILALVGDPTAARAFGWAGTRPLAQGVDEMIRKARTRPARPHII